MVNSNEFVKRLEKILEYYAITATAFAEKLTLNRSTISHLLSGRNKPSLDFIMKVSENFPEVDLDWLVFGKGSFPADAKFSEENVKTQRAVSPKQESDLFSTENDTSEKKNLQAVGNLKSIEKIVIFFKDGSFKVYQN